MSGGGMRSACTGERPYRCVHPCRSGRAACAEAWSTGWARKALTGRGDFELVLRGQGNQGGLRCPRAVLNRASQSHTTPFRRILRHTALPRPASVMHPAGDLQLQSAPAPASRPCPRPGLRSTLCSTATAPPSRTAAATCPYSACMGRTGCRYGSTGAVPFTDSCTLLWWW